MNKKRKHNNVHITYRGQQIPGPRFPRIFSCITWQGIHPQPVRNMHLPLWGIKSNNNLDKAILSIDMTNTIQFKHLKRHYFIFLLFVVLISCKEETSYRMQILIKNETDSKQTVQLFPKSEYLMNGRNDFYMYSDLGNGDYGDKYFDIEPGESNNLFITADLSQEPSDLALKIFDSIYIVPFNESKTIMKFYPDSVIGYEENLFNENSIWIYEVRNYDEPTNFKQNPVESHEYSFVISTDNDE